MSSHDQDSHELWLYPVAMPVNVTRRPWAVKRASRSFFDSPMFASFFFADASDFKESRKACLPICWDTDRGWDAFRFDVVIAWRRSQGDTDDNVPLTPFCHLTESDVVPDLTSLRLADLRWFWEERGRMIHTVEGKLELSTLLLSCKFKRH